MAKTRVHELAKEFGVESKTILTALKTLGEFVKSASSTVNPPAEMRLRKHLAESGTDPVRRAGGSPASTPSTSRAPAASSPGVDVARRTAAREAAALAGITPPGAQRARLRNETPSPEAPQTGASPATPSVGRPPAAPPAPAANLPSAARAQSARTVAIHSLSSDRDLRIVLRECKRAQRNDKRLLFDLSDASGFYPSIAVPAVAIVQHFRRVGVSVDLTNLPRIADTMRLRNPLEASRNNLDDLSEPLSRIWVYFDHHQASALTTAFMDCIRRKVECKEGVLEALEWCLMEVLDNVTQHSRSGAGFAMLQLHASSKRLAVCVSDTGIGVQRSLASSAKYKPATSFDALTLAVREGVTRDDRSNQGNGLFGLVKILEQNGGRLNLTSGRGRMLLEGDRFSGANDQEFVGADNHGTTVDFQLQIDKPVSLGDALNYSPTNMFLESLESDDGEHVISIRNQAGGSGSRKAARELKTLIVNVLNDGAPHVVLDFEGQAVVSSSFADEVIGKMFAEMGFNVFNRRIKLVNMNATVSSLVDRAIALRLSQGST